MGNQPDLQAATLEYRNAEAFPSIGLNLSNSVRVLNFQMSRYQFTILRNLIVLTSGANLRIR